MNNINHFIVVVKRNHVTCGLYAITADKKKMLEETFKSDKDFVIRYKPVNKSMYDKCLRIQKEVEDIGQ